MAVGSSLLPQELNKTVAEKHKEIRVDILIDRFCMLCFLTGLFEYKFRFDGYHQVTPGTCKVCCIRGNAFCIFHAPGCGHHAEPKFHHGYLVQCVSGKEVKLAAQVFFYRLAIDVFLVFGETEIMIVQCSSKSFVGTPVFNFCKWIA